MVPKETDNGPMNVLALSKKKNKVMSPPMNNN
jgi:hypothetical protein